MSAIVADKRSNAHKWADWSVVTHGFAVFPLPQGHKKPSAGGLGITSATTDPAQIAEWWTAQPDANIGIVGDPNATDKFLLRVDVDTKHGGMDAWASFIAKHGPIKTLTTRTPSGGLHLYLHTRKPLGNSRGTLPTGIDIRGHSTGYTVGPPSVTCAVPGESVAGRYEFIDAQDRIVNAPEWLLELIGAERHKEQPVEAFKTLNGTQLAELRDALLSDGMLRDWARWSDNGLALRSLGDAGYVLWVEYSQRQLEAFADRAVGSDTADTWWSRHRARGIKSDYRSIFTRAQALGWKNPRAVDTTKLGFGQQPLPPTANTAPLMTAPTQRFHVINGRDFASGPDPEWRIDGILPERGLAMIYGPSGCGKSFFAIDAAMTIARGKSYGLNQRIVKQGRVVYVVAEGAGGFRQRLRAYDQHHRLHASDPTVSVITAAPNLMDGGDSTLLRDAIVAAGGADVVVIDTVHASMAGGEENSAKDMGIVLGHCRAIQEATNGLVVLIHHSGKDSERGARGSSAIRAAMDTEIEVTRGDGGQRAARITKQRDGEDGITVTTFELRPVFGTGSALGAVVVHVEPTAVCNKRSSAIKDRIVETLRAYPDGVAVDVLFMEVVSTRKSDGKSEPRRDNLKRSLLDLIQSGAVRQDADRVHLLWE